jgi:hypothetical protein
VGIGFQPLGPIDVSLPLSTTQTKSSSDQSTIDKSIFRFQHIHQQVQEILQKSNAKYKQCHDQHMVPHQFQVGDKFGYICRRSVSSGPIRKLFPLCYGPYTITKVVGSNYFELNTPPFLGLHPVFNVDLLRPYFPPLLDTYEITEQLTPTDLNPDCMEQASTDQIVDTQVKGTRQQWI